MYFPIQEYPSAMWKLVILLIRKRPDPEPESMSIEHVRMTDTVMHTKDARINATMGPGMLE